MKNLKVANLKNDLLDDLRVEIKDIIKKSLYTNSTHSTTSYITEIKSLKRELDIKERMITQLLTTRDCVTSYSNNSNDIFQSEVIFEKP